MEFIQGITDFDISVIETDVQIQVELIFLKF